METNYEFLPWISLSGEEREETEAIQSEISQREDIKFSEGCVVSKDAHFHSVKGSFGKRNLIASHALLRCLTIETGENCSFNTYSVVHGKVKIGDNVRIAPGAKIFGENHGFSQLDVPICRQPNTQKGIIIENNVWIGTNAVICDGVTIGEGSIVGAGAVVTKCVPPFTVVGGSPARVLKARRADMKNDDEFKDKIVAFGKKVTKSYQDILDNFFTEGRFINGKNHPEERRGICDAVEIAAFFGDTPRQMKKEDIIARINAFQEDKQEYECVLSASYALEILGEKPVYFSYVNSLDVWEFLDSLSWKNDAWDAGHHTDIFATACYMNKKHYQKGYPKDLFLWLALNQSMDGLWGEGDINLRVNGYYRLTRGTYDQFKLKPSYVKDAIDTILDYSEKKGVPDNACDALDIVHPLYFTHGFTSYRRSEGEAWCVKMLPKFMDMFTEKGFAFRVGEEATLKGTEMWLSIIYLMCDYLSLGHLLGYEPKGVHRTK